MTDIIAGSGTLNVTQGSTAVTFEEFDPSEPMNDVIAGDTLSTSYGAYPIAAVGSMGLTLAVAYMSEYGTLAPSKWAILRSAPARSYAINNLADGEARASFRARAKASTTYPIDDWWDSPPGTPTAGLWGLVGWPGSSLYGGGHQDSLAYFTGTTWVYIPPKVGDEVVRTSDGWRAVYTADGWLDDAGIYVTADTMPAKSRLEPVFIVGFGDSRIACGTSGQDQTGASAAVSDTYILNPDTLAWRDAMTFDVAPYTTGHNHWARETAIKARNSGKYGARPIYLLSYGVAGSTIYSWCAGDAAHGVGPNPSTNFNTLKTQLAAAFASAEFVAAGKTTIDEINVSLLTNNGGAEYPAALGYMGNIVSQVRQAGFMPGTTPDLPILWWEVPRGDLAGAYFHNRTIRDFAAKNEKIAVVSAYGIELLPDAVHDHSRGMVVRASRILEASARLGLGVDSPDGDKRYVVSGGTAAAPLATMPEGIDGITYIMTGTSADAYVSFTASNWAIGQRFSVQNKATGGGLCFVVPASGHTLERTDTPAAVATGNGGATAIYTNSVLVAPGETVTWVVTSATAAELVGVHGRAVRGISLRGGAAGDVAYAADAVVTDWSVSASSVLTHATGVVTCREPGWYRIAVNIYTKSGSNGYLQIQRSDDGTTWTAVTPAANGNSSTAWARTTGAVVDDYASVSTRYRAAVKSSSMTLTMTPAWSAMSVVRL